MEAAITLPALVLMCMIVVQYALLWHGRHVVEAAARDGVEAARGYQATTGDGAAAVKDYLNGVAPQLVLAPSIAVTRSATNVTVTVRARILRVIPAGSYTVDESASGPVERFIAAGLVPGPVVPGAPDAPRVPDAPGVPGTLAGSGVWL